MSARLSEPNAPAAAPEPKCRDERRRSITRIRGLTSQLNWTMTKLGAGPYQLIVLMLGGGVYAAEGSLLLMLSVIAKGLIVKWELSPMAAASMATLVLTGLIIGTIAGGFYCDRYGRRGPVLITYAGISAFLIIAITVPGLLLLLLAKFMLGFALGFGVPAANAIVCESCPPAHRSNIYSLTMVLFSAGQIYSATIIWIISPNIDHEELHWRWMLALAAALPFVLLIFAYFLLLESPHWVVANDRIDEAKDVIRSIAWYKTKHSDSRESILSGADEFEEYTVEELVRSLEASYKAAHEGSSSNIEEEGEGEISSVSSAVEEGEGERAPLLGAQRDSLNSKDSYKPPPKLKGGWGDDWARVQILFSDEYWSTTLIMCWVCFVCNFAYYGMIYGLPDTLKRAFNEAEKDQQDHSPAAGVLMAAMFEIPGVFVAIILGITVGRRANMCIAYFMVALCLCLTVWGILSHDMENVGMVGVFGVKLFIASGFIVTYLYLLEAYRTKFRATALAFCMVVGRLGAFICPFLYDGLIMANISYAWFFVVMAVLALSASILVLFLQIETKDAQLMDV